MTESEPRGLIQRAKNILLKPKEEWARIDAEPATVGGIMTRWVVPLAAIGPVAGVIGGQVFGYGAFGVTYRPTIAAALTSAVIGYLLALAAVFVLARIIDLLAPSFGGQKDAVQAMKVAAYSGTASFLAGVIELVPGLAILGLLGLYSLYLLYLGLPRLMRAPEGKAMGYTVVTVIVAFVLFLAIGAVTSVLTAAIAPRATIYGGGTMSGSVNIPGVGKVDMGKVEQASARVEAAAEKARDATPVDRGALAELLPAQIGRWTRESIESSSASAGGMGGSQAEARYVAGESAVELKVIDLASAGALAAMASAMKIETSRETADGYEKAGTVDERFVTEKWNKDGKGTYSELVGDRFLVEARGTAPHIGALKARVGAVDMGKLARLADQD